MTTTLAAPDEQEARARLRRNPEKFSLVSGKFHRKAAQI